MHMSLVEGQETVLARFLWVLRGGGNSGTGTEAGLAGEGCGISKLSSEYR